MVLKTSLEYLGLVSLQSIQNGNAGVADNPKLCYRKGIPWSEILRHDNQTSRVYRNMPDVDCGESSSSFFSFPLIIVR